MFASFTASTTPGFARGKKIGFPTLNLQNITPNLLQTGVYAVFVTLDDSLTKLPGMMHVGPRPTFKASDSCEVHVLNTILTYTPQTVCIIPVQKIREVIAFNSVDDLIIQLRKDEKVATIILNDANN